MLTAPEPLPEQSIPKDGSIQTRQTGVPIDGKPLLPNRSFTRRVGEFSFVPKVLALSTERLSEERVCTSKHLT